MVLGASSPYLLPSTSLSHSWPVGIKKKIYTDWILVEQTWFSSILVKHVFPEHRSPHLVLPQIYRGQKGRESVNGWLAGWNIGFMSVGVQSRGLGHRHACSIAALGMAFPFPPNADPPLILRIISSLNTRVSPTTSLSLTSPKDRNTSFNLQAAPQVLARWRPTTFLKSLGEEKGT